MSNYTIRRATLADAPAVDALTQAAYAKWVPIVGRKPRPMLVDYAQAVVDHRIDLLEVGGRLAALVELDRQPDHVLIVNLAVHPEYQGQGFGKLLLGHAESVAREAGLAELRLYTNKLMTVNIELYGRHGYAIDREEVYPAGGITIHMSKHLAS